MARHILFVGKSDSVLDPIWPRLESRGMRVTLAASQRSAIEHARKRSPDLIIIDGTVFLSSKRLCRSLQRVSPHSAVILLADEHGQPDDVPCDLQLRKPFTARKLITRIDKVLEQHAPKLLRVGSLVLDLATRTVQGARGEQKLTPKECAILAMLMEHPGEVISRQQLMESIWKTSYLGDTRTLEVHVYWLRQKVEADPDTPRYIITVRGQGYRLNVPSSEKRRGQAQ